jgi:hypothetical protein
MLIAGVLKFDPQGRIILSAGPPIDFNGGTPIGADGGLAAAVEGADPNLYFAAIGYLDNGAITDSDNPLVPGHGVLTNDQGQVRISHDLPVYWYAGLPLTAEGFLSISDGIIPPVIGPGAFDQGFNNAFDNGSP